MGLEQAKVEDMFQRSQAGGVQEVEYSRRQA